MNSSEAKKHAEAISGYMKDLFNFKDEKEEERYYSALVSLRALKPIKDYMDEENISQKELANMIGKTPAYINQVFSGMKPLNMKMIYRIEKALGVKLLLNLEVSNPRESATVIDFQDFSNRAITQKMDLGSSAQGQLKTVSHGS